MVEMAVVLPVLILLVMGIIEFAIAFNATQGLHAAAREGARTASIPTSTQTDVQGRVDAALAGLSFDSTPVMTVPTGGCDGREGEEVRVELTAPHTINVALLPAVTVTLNATGVFRCE